MPALITQAHFAGHQRISHIDIIAEFSPFFSRIWWFSDKSGLLSIRQFGAADAAAGRAFSPVLWWCQSSTAHDGRGTLPQADYLANRWDRIAERGWTSQMGFPNFWKELPKMKGKTRWRTKNPVAHMVTGFSLYSNKNKPPAIQSDPSHRCEGLFIKAILLFFQQDTKADS